MTQTPTTPKEYLTEVRGQYEVLPYPSRNPAKERDDLFMTDAMTLDALNHYGFGGKRDFRKGVRVLVAGQGTGDVPVFMAEQLRGYPVEIVTVDLSTRSIATSKARLAQRGLTNVTHYHMSILDLPTAGLGKFDIIECGGVLHHLESPEAGLAALQSVLAEDGIMVVMVYAFYGRMALYLMQSLLSYLVTDEMDPMLKINITREFLKAVPDTHWLGLTGSQFVTEIQWPDGSGLYDLFLHSTDRAYTVPQVHEWVEGAGLQFGRFVGDMLGNGAYLPEAYTNSPLLLKLCATKPETERQAIAELMQGSMIKHHFYAMHHTGREAQFADDMVINLTFRQQLYPDFIPAIQDALRAVPVGNSAEANVRSTITMPNIWITHNTHTVALLGAIDNTRTIGEMVVSVSAAANADAAVVRDDLELLYNELFQRQRVFLRHKDVPPYIHYKEINARLATIPPITEAV